jgi:AcrR family transcriptional regulator
MVEQTPRRRYEMRKRADDMEDTRLRITDATVELHGSVGPARTTVSAIAERAGVQRHTVYRHFPSDEDLFAACTARYWSVHPWPDRDAWDEIAAPPQRLATALDELYRFYPTIAPMMNNVLRDADEVLLVARAAQFYVDLADDMARRLGSALADGCALTVAAVRHAVDFRTWQSLVQRNGIDPATAVGLMVAMVLSSVLDPAGEPGEAGAGGVDGPATED